MDFNDKLFDFLVATNKLDNFLGKDNKNEEKEKDSESKTNYPQEEDTSNIKQDRDKWEKNKDFNCKD